MQRSLGNCNFSLAFCLMGLIHNSFPVLMDVMLNAHVGSGASKRRRSSNTNLGFALGQLPICSCIIKKATVVGRFSLALCDFSYKFLVCILQLSLLYTPMLQCLQSSSR